MKKPPNPKPARKAGSRAVKTDPDLDLALQRLRRPGRIYSSEEIKRELGL
jgi:hypothetical protein